jgi:hypothetical protein
VADRRSVLIATVRELCEAVSGSRYRVLRSVPTPQQLERMGRVVTIMTRVTSMTEADPSGADAAGEVTGVILTWLAPIRATAEEIDDDILDEMRRDMLAVLRAIPGSMAVKHVQAGIPYARAAYNEFHGLDHGYAGQGLAVTFEVFTGSTET